MLTANKTSHKTERTAYIAEKIGLTAPQTAPKCPARFMNPGTFDLENETNVCLLWNPGSLQNAHRSTRTSAFWFELKCQCWCDCIFGHIPMTTALAAISSNRNTKPIDTPHTTIMSNHTLNTFLQGLLDKDDVLGEEEGYIDDDGAVDDDKRKAYMARQEEEEERKRNLLLLTLMQTF